MGRYSRVLFLAALLAAAIGNAPLGARSSAKLEPLGEEAYQVLVHLFDYSPSAPLDARVVQLRRREGYAREKVVFRGARGRLVPGYLEFPANGTPPFPCVLLLHGWSGSKENWWQDGGYISGGEVRKSLLAAGYAVFALDAQCHGERQTVNDYAPVNDYLAADGSRNRGNHFTLPEIYTQTVSDYRRGLDYLATRTEVNMERIGMLGYSMGGQQTFVLTAVEPRIKVSVACVAPPLREKFNCVAPVHYARGVKGRPFLMLMGRKDEMYTVEEVQRMFDLVQSSSKKLIFYDSGHKLTTDYVQDAAKWIREHL